MIAAPIYEERVAGLEATAARKGNRKVSLTISGWVNEAVYWWDDGTQHKTYVGTNDMEQSRFRFTGEAKIHDGWPAGFTLEIGTDAPAQKAFDQNAGFCCRTVNFTDDPTKSNWLIKSKGPRQGAVGGRRAWPTLSWDQA